MIVYVLKLYEVDENLQRYVAGFAGVVSDREKAIAWAKNGDDRADPLRAWTPVELDYIKDNSMTIDTVPLEVHENLKMQHEELKKKHQDLLHKLGHVFKEIGVGAVDLGLNIVQPGVPR